jgi:hypothetical protein
MIWVSLLEIVGKTCQFVSSTNPYSAATKNLSILVRSKYPVHCGKCKLVLPLNFSLLLLNDYEADPYFLQLFQSNTTVCLIIYEFCKSCEPVLICTLAEQFHVRKSYATTRKSLLEILKKISNCLVFI